MTLEEDPSRSEDVKNATGEEQKTITNSSRKNAASGPKRETTLVVDMSDGKSKVQCYKQYCVGT